MTIEDQIAAELDTVLLNRHSAAEQAAAKQAEYQAMEVEVTNLRSRAQQLRLALFNLNGQQGGALDADIANATRLEDLLNPSAGEPDPVEEPPTEEPPVEEPAEPGEEPVE